MKHPLKNNWQRRWLALDAWHPKIHILADAAEKFCSNWFFNKPGCKRVFVLVGTTGIGKSHTAIAIYNFAHLAAFSAFCSKSWGSVRVPTAYFLKWPEAANAFTEKQFGCVDDANNADLLILDDIGAENDPWKICADKLCQVLSRRENKFTVITTNISPENWSERFDARISDRLLRNSTIVDLTDVGSYALK